MDDKELLAGLKSQKPAAVQHLSDCFVPSVWRLVYVRSNRDTHLTEDIVSETVLALLRALAEDKPGIENPGAWLRTVACNKLTDHFRAAARVQHLLDEAKKITPTLDEKDPVKQKELEERREEVRTVMEQLPEQQRMVLEWKYLDKFSVREIAERLSASEKAIESILFRARREFRKRLFVSERQTEHPNNSQHTNGASKNRSARPPNGAAIKNTPKVASDSKTALNDIQEQSQLK